LSKIARSSGGRLTGQSHMNKIRILFLPVIEAGNTNAQSLNAREIALRLDPARFECTLWYEHSPDSRLRDAAGIRLLQLPARRKSLTILKEMLVGYDIISYIDYSPATYLFLRLPRTVRGNTKAVMHAEAPSAQIENPPRMLRFLYKGIVPNCDVYTAITDFVARDVCSSLRRRVDHILPVGVDTSMFTPPEKRVNQTPVVLFAGTIIERKGPQYVIDAAARYPGAMFQLAGSARGGFDNVLREKISRLKLENVQMLGPKKQSEMIDIMRASDIFLLPSRLEGIPKVTLEAAATGLPCIVFKDYETPSVVDGVTGFQVQTVEEMMQALGRLLEDRQLRERMGAAAREHVKGFDWDKVSTLWQNAYLQIAGQGN